MSVYGTEWSHEDGIDDLHINRNTVDPNAPLELWTSTGGWGLELDKEKARDLANYLTKYYLGEL